LILPFETSPISPDDTDRLREAFAESGKQAWCYFVPFLCSYHLPPGREVRIGTWRGAIWIVQQRVRDDQVRYDLMVPPLPFDSESLVAFREGLTRGGLAGGRVLWADEVDAQRAADAGFQTELKEREYVYDPKRIAAASGSAFRDVRKRVRRFRRDTDGRILEMRSQDLGACETLLKAWRRKQGRKSGFLLDWGYTRKALTLFGAWDARTLRGWCVETAGGLTGFALAGAMAEGVANFFVLKTDPDVFGLSEYLRWHVFHDLQEYDRVNDAGDLDLPGLRQHKAKFRPVARPSVYTIEPGRKEVS